jgi:hypothetical protein
MQADLVMPAGDAFDVSDLRPQVAKLVQDGAVVMG